MTIAELVIFVFALLLGIAGTAWATRKFDLRRENFRKERIPAMAGVVLVVSGVFFYGVEWIEQGIHVATAATYFLVTFAFGALGMLDDIAGDRSIGGFRGHVGALMRGKLTTGFAKMLGGGIVSLVAGFLLYWPLFWQALLAAVLIALTANTLNLLDLRPGRCLFGFFLGATAVISLLAWQHHLNVAFLFYFAVAIALIIYPLDALGAVMLGDTGSNAFGSILGVAMALFLPWQAQVAVVFGMTAFQIRCERHSWSKTVENNRVLRAIDSRIGVR
jgi:UDP-GlcNAc:undecaprenyl-phosphate GlcNAc-1-phosphate transferase